MPRWFVITNIIQAFQSQEGVLIVIVIIFYPPSGIMNNISLSLDNTAVPTPGHLARRNRWNVGGGGTLSISQGQAGFALVAIRLANVYTIWLLTPDSLLNY